MHAIVPLFLLLIASVGCGDDRVASQGASSQAARGTASGAPARGAAAPALDDIDDDARPAFHGQVTRVGAVASSELSLPYATVCIPREASVDAHRAFSVLYATDGDYFVGELGLCAIVEALTKRGAIAPWVVVGIPSTGNRTTLLAGQAEALGRLIVEKLEPEIAALVPLIASREQRAVLGYSYGGLAAVRIAIAAGADIGRVIAMSPSLWFAQRSALGSFEHMRGPLPLRLYVDVGAREGDPGEVVPYMVADARELVGIARVRGLRFGRDVALREVPGQDHDMALARGRLPNALSFALGDRDLSSEKPVALAFDVSEAPTRRSARTFSVDATYGSRLVLSWPADLASARLGARVLDDARIPPDARGMVSLHVNGFSALRPID